MEACKLDYKNCFTKLRFRAQLKRACDSNGVLKDMASWNMPTFVEKRLVSTLTVQMTSYEDSETTHRQLKAGE